LSKYNLQLLLVLETVLKFGLIGIGDISSFGNVLLPFIDFIANTGLVSQIVFSLLILGDNVLGNIFLNKKQK